jgi:peptidoglycan/xylan/chitin deacetylase (PgdA/CDA1 family)
VWPGGARGALCLSFDNLGEAAELELGALSADAQLGEHFTATRALPSLLDLLQKREIAATFFVEGLNAEIYPDLLREIDARGHEIAYHAWRHEQWGDLTAAEQEENLARGIAAFEALGIELAGIRPPGGQLGPGGVGMLHDAGLHYCSPAGEGMGIEDGVALLPFQWRHVDASCVLPALGTVREQMASSPEPLDPDACLAYLEGEVSRLAVAGGFAAFVLHLPMFDWWGEERLNTLLDQLTESSAERRLWLAPCRAAAEHVLAHPDAFRNSATLDPTSWA